MERIKNEVHQRRIPTREGGSTNMVDLLKIEQDIKHLVMRSQD